MWRRCWCRSALVHSGVLLVAIGVSAGSAAASSFVVVPPRQLLRQQLGGQGSGRPRWLLCPKPHAVCLEARSFSFRMYVLRGPTQRGPERDRPQRTQRRRLQRGQSCTVSPAGSHAAAVRRKGQFGAGGAASGGGTTHYRTGKPFLNCSRLPCSSSWRGMAGRFRVSPTPYQPPCVRHTCRPARGLRSLPFAGRRQLIWPGRKLWP